MADSDEDDYMSDAFLNKLPDTRPGLVPPTRVREFELEKKHKELNQAHRKQYRPVKVLEKEKREEGLGMAIGSGNKGFALMQKMGFKEGMVLGKRGEGRAEPIPLEVKEGRGGLGHEAEVKRKRAKQMTAWSVRAGKRQRIERQQRQEFLDHHKQQFSNKVALRDLGKSQKACEQLDAAKGIQKPTELFFWPANRLPAAKPKKSSSEDTKAMMEDMSGYSRHVVDVEEDEEDEEENAEEEEEEEDPAEQFTDEEKLQILTTYLRTEHLYCIWCGTRFNDTDDLQSNCPGSTAADHDD